MFATAPIDWPALALSRIQELEAKVAKLEAAAVGMDHQTRFALALFVGAIADQPAVNAAMLADAFDRLLEDKLPPEQPVPLAVLDVRTILRCMVALREAARPR